MTNQANLQGLFTPAHIAVIGASSTPGKIGNIVVRNLIKGGFAGRISPVNATGAAVEGLAAYRALADLDGTVDVAFVVVPAAAVADAVQQCAAAGVRYAVIGASGFAELGDEAGIGRQATITRIARESGLRLVGPNTNGILSTQDRLPLGYNASHADAMEPGRVSVVSHSGALFDGVARRLRSLGAGLAKFIPVGNEADLSMLDFLEFLIDDPATDIIGLIIEGLDDGPRFRRLAAAARAQGKPIVALKIGRSTAGAQAALAHSSRLAGSARAYQALFRESGVATVPTVEALAGACAVLAGLPTTLPADPRLICVSSSGAGGALVMDVASERGLPLAATAEGLWPEAIATPIRQLPTAAPIRHPIDLGSLGDWSLLSPVLDILGAAEQNGPLIAYSHIAAQPAMTEALLAALTARRARGGCVLLLAPGGLTEPVEARYRAAGVPVFHDTAACFDSLAAVYTARLWPAPAPIPSLAIDADRRADVRAMLNKAAARDPGQSVLSELDSAEVLRRVGVPMVRSVAVPNVQAAQETAETLGFPLVLKALVPGIAHKHDHGLVVVGIADAAQLADEYAALIGRAQNAGAERDAIVTILQPFHRSQAELILGLSSEGPLGVFLVAGFGGLNAELLDEVVLLPVPLAPEVLRARLAEGRVGRLLAAVAGPRRDRVLEEVASVLQSLQILATEQPELIRSVDINPLLVGKTGCVAVDALVVLAQ
jgi:acyl-CoA synthetase (NDP forming)